ncbi:uncharacterized protein B0H64DRAFT_356238 [Chaetomium fimeti]|uniref:SP-RING-type domain-containing protein n=1 Tax=Chaetomium fimeti TaxID=1854472 RepID=A0AAE0LT21_9PEZI|nr:hypothetical protein B0H64DRAFT_356238 [Chaetomium fimeti]
MGSITPSAPATHPVTNARFVHVPSRTPDVQEIPRPGSVGATPQAESHSPAPGHILQPPSNRLEAGQNTHAPNVSHGGPPSSSSTSHEHGPPPPPAKRRRTENTPSIPPAYMPSVPPACIPPLIPTLEQYVQASGGEQALDGSVEKPRIMLLREACKTEDTFFIFLHQLFSMWSLKRQDVRACIPLSQSTVNEAFAILETVLKKNQLISPPHQQWFSRFPVPLGQFDRWNNGGVIIQQIARFLSALVKDYGNLAIAAIHRKYPFLVDELLSRLSCYSPVLQYILFTACRRRLGVPDGQFGGPMEQAFREDQHRHRAPGQNNQFLVPFTHAGEIEQRNSGLIHFYRQTVQAATRQTSGQSNLRSPPMLNTSAPLQQQASASMQGQTQPPNRMSPVHNAQQHQAAPIAYSVPNYLPALYPSMALPPSPQAPTAATNPYTTPQTPTVTGPTQMASLGANTSTSHPQIRNAPHSNPQHPAVSNVWGQQPQPVQFVWQQQQALNQGQQLRAQQVNQQLNQQHYVQNLQISTSNPAQVNPQPMTQSPVSNAPSYRTTHPAQSPRLQQIRPSPWMLQQIQTSMSPTGFVAGVAHPGSTPTAQSPTHQIQRGAQQRQRTVTANDRLLPPKGAMIGRTEWPHEPADRKSVMMSLHQAHVRSPKRVIKDGETERFYQSVKSLSVAPTPVAPKKTMYEFRFDVTEEQFALVAAKSKNPTALLPVVEHFNGALRWRIRCCVVRGPNGPLREEEWVGLEMDWPAYIHMTLNNKALDIRRQRHNGKDQPTEITDYIVCGTNVLLVAIHGPQGEQVKNRHLAVEMLETLSHSSAVRDVWARGVTPEEQTLKTIKRRLTSSLDDEVSFEAPDLPIDLADPFSSTIFKIPARGATCTHMECFDLENWLNTRPSKTPVKCPHRQVECDCRDPGEPSNPDKWRCPICSKDARPYSLRIDGFLLNVRTQLEEEGRLHTKCLRVKADGSWSVVLEADDDGESDEEERHGSRPAATAKGKAVQVPTAPRREVEVIEID